MDYPITIAPDGSQGITIAVTYANGQLGIMFMYLRRFDKEGKVSWDRDISDSEIEAEIAKAFNTDANRDRLPVQKWRVLDGAMQKTPYMGAWVDTGVAIEHDMPKARDIHRNILRRERAVAMADLDAAYMRADEQGDSGKKRAIAQKKQLLRDAPADPRIEAASTIDDLKVITLPSDP